MIVNQIFFALTARPVGHGRFACLLLGSCLAWLAGTHTGLASVPEADLIVVRKSERTLSLVRQNTVLRTFPIKLGANPVGHKRGAGDSRTPEGRYFIDFKNPDSRFFLSLKISYPNAHDRARARARGEQPGGNIMIHGLPERQILNDNYYDYVDWTDGCIAVSNQAIAQIWEAVREQTPVVIYP